MGEIKSTLDLVMKKTRHLTLSAEEKQQQSRLQKQKLFKGLLQRHLDGLLSLEQLKDQIQQMQKTTGLDAARMRTEIFDRIGLDQDNALWLAVAKELFGFDCSGLDAVLEEYRLALDAAEKQRRNDLKDALAQTSSIKGSAVVPNLEADPQWVSEWNGIRTCFQEMLDRLKQSD